MSAASCTHCGGTLEARTVVYFEIEETRAGTGRDDGEELITALRFSSANDSLDGHPCALGAEFEVRCKDCDAVAEAKLDEGEAMTERTAFAPYAVTPEGEVIS